MTDLNDKTKRQTLIRRYINAETTVEEERLLQNYYAHVEDELTPEEEDLRLIIISTTRLAGDVGLSDEKEDEFDKMMEGATVGEKSHKIPPVVLWSSSMAAALLLAMLLITKGTMNDPAVTHQYAKTTITTTHSSQQASLEDKPQQKEKETEFEVAMEEDGVTAQKPTTLAYDTEMQEKDMSIKDEKKPEATEIEPSEKEIPTMTTINTTTVHEPRDKRYPLNVTAANYGRGHQKGNHFLPSGNVTIVTKSISEGSVTHYALINSENGVRMLYTEMPDDSVIYLIDGKRVTKDIANHISPDSIKEIRRLKKGTSDAIREDPDGQTHDIILITTKGSDDQSQDHSSAPRRNSPLISDHDINIGICLL